MFKRCWRFQPLRKQKRDTKSKVPRPASNGLAESPIHNPVGETEVPQSRVSTSRVLIVAIALHLADVAGEADHLVAVAELVVVPQIQNHGLAVFADLGGRCVEDAGATVADAIARDELGVAAEADLLDEVALQAGLAEGFVHLFDGGLTFKVEGQHCQGDIGRRHTHGVARQLAFQLGDGLGCSLAGTRLGDDHVQGGAAATTLLLVVVVQEVLVVGVAVDGLDVALHDAEVLQHDLEAGHDGVGGAAGSREDLFVLKVECVLVDTINDIRDVALAGSGEQHLADTLGLEVTRQRLTIAEGARIVDEQGIVDAIFGVVEVLWVLGFEEEDLLSVDHHGVFALDGGAHTVEVTVHRVGTEQVDTLGDVLRRVLTGDDGAHTQSVATASHLRHFAAEDTTDTTEAVEDDILHLVAAWHGIDDVAELVADKLRHVVIVLFVLVSPLRVEAAKVDTCGSQVLGQQSLGDEKRILHADRLAQHVGGTQVLVQDLARTTVDQQRTQHDEFHRFVIPQFAYDVDEFVGSFFVFIPSLQGGFEIVVVHDCNFYSTIELMCLDFWQS